MFGSKKSVSVAAAELETVVGKGTTIKGTIQSERSIRIDGVLEGDLITQNSAIIGDTGVVKAQIKAVNANIAGTVHGNMDVTEKVELLPTAKVYGDIKVGSLVIGEGAIFKGKCEMRDNNFNGDKK